MLSRIIYAVGFYKLGMPIATYATQYYNHHHREEQENRSNDERLRKTYGGQWAVVTGASEGIGKAFAVDLAKAGYDVMIASRSQAKLDKVADEIKMVCPERQVRVTPIDLAATKDYSAIAGDAEVMSNLGIVVNNAGQMVYGKFLDIDPAKLQTEGQLNLNAITLVSKHALNSFEKSRARNQKLGLVQLSSSATWAAGPIVAHYSATKRFNETFALLVNRELHAGVTSRGVDTLSVHPGLVTTPMVSEMNIPYASSLPEETSRGCLRDLGYVL